MINQTWEMGYKQGDLKGQLRGYDDGYLDGFMEGANQIANEFNLSLAQVLPYLQTSKEWLQKEINKKILEGLTSTWSHSPGMKEAECNVADRPEDP